MPRFAFPSRYASNGGMSRLILPLLLAGAVALGVSGLRGAPEYPNRGPDIYDPTADGTVLINAALQRARAEHKRVLLDFGANWCPWCHLLHQVFTTNPEVARLLGERYVLVMVDVNRRHGTARNAAVNEKYGNPIRLGLPVLVVLDATGRVIATQDTGALEKGDGTEADDPAKVLAMLQRWAGP